MKNPAPTSVRALALLTAIGLAALSQPAAAQAVMNNVAAVKAGAPMAGFIVKYRDNTLERADPRLVSGALSHLSTQLRTNPLMQAPDNARAIAPFGLQHTRRMALGADVVRPSGRLSPAQALEVMRRLAQLPGVEYVEPDLLMQEAFEPNDRLYSEQWGLSSAHGIRAPQAWDLADGAGVTIAILDSGISAHNDLQGNLVPGYDFISDAATSRDGNGRDADPSDPGNWRTPGQCAVGSLARDSNWHGTHVAGIAAAVSNNANGIAGVAPRAKIMPVRVLGACGGIISDIADAIVWAAGRAVAGVPTLAAGAQAKVINLSLTGPGTCQYTYQQAVFEAVYRGATVVTAAGNSGQDAALFQPGNCADVVNVANTDASGERHASSNFGAKVDLAAPGTGIMSTYNSGLTTPAVQDYEEALGNSQSAPHVSGTVALMQSRRLALGKPLLPPEEVEILLKSTASAFPVPCAGCGAGIVNAHAAVIAAAGASTKLGEQTDASGKIQIALFTRTALVEKAHFNDFAIDVPDDYVVIGGGAEGQKSPGILLTASYPNADLSAWVVSSKDHIIPSLTKLRGWAIGLKIAGLSRQQLRDAMVVSEAVSASAAAPGASATLPAGYALIGGGVRVAWAPGAGNLALASYPSGFTSWNVQSAELRLASPATVRAYAIGLRKQIDGVGNLRSVLIHTYSAPSANPAARLAVFPGYALAGCGAHGLYNPNRANNFLWRIQPVLEGAFAGCEVNFKEHIDPSTKPIIGFAVGLQAY